MGLTNALSTLGEENTYPSQNSWTNADTILVMIQFPLKFDGFPKRTRKSRGSLVKRKNEGMNEEIFVMSIGSWNNRAALGLSLKGLHDHGVLAFGDWSCRLPRLFIHLLTISLVNLIIFTFRQEWVSHMAQAVLLRLWESWVFVSPSFFSLTSSLTNSQTYCSLAMEKLSMLENADAFWVGYWLTHLAGRTIFRKHITIRMGESWYRSMHRTVSRGGSVVGLIQE